MENIILSQGRIQPGGAQGHVPRQWLQAWVYPYYFLTCQSPFSQRFHHEGAHLGTNAGESIYKLYGIT